MTIVNTATGEITEAMDEAAAKRITERIRLLSENVAEQVEKLATLIEEARVGSAWLALGYRSWPEYVSTEFANVLPRLDRVPRQEFVRELASHGMSTRAIAPVVGASQRTVANDLSNVAHQTPQGEVVRTPVVPDATTGAPTATPRPAVIGLDGKSYTPSPPKPRLAPAPEQYTAQDRAEDCARMLARNLSGLYALTSAERRAEFIATWAAGTDDIAPLGADFVTPTHMRALSAALLDFATEWETADA